MKIYVNLHFFETQITDQASIFLDKKIFVFKGAGETKTMYFTCQIMIGSRLNGIIEIK